MVDAKTSKICCSQGRAGSSSAWGTIPSNLHSKTRGRRGSLLLHLKRLAPLVPAGFAGARRAVQGWGPCQIAPNTGLNLGAVEPDVLQLVVGHVPELRDGHPLQAPIHVSAPPAPKAAGLQCEEWRSQHDRAPRVALKLLAVVSVSSRVVFLSGKARLVGCHGAARLLCRRSAAGAFCEPCRTSLGRRMTSRSISVSPSRFLVARGFSDNLAREADRD